MVVLSLLSRIAQVSRVPAQSRNVSDLLFNDEDNDDEVYVRQGMQ